MKLVPTLEKMVGDIVAKDFWDNHSKIQDMLDRQCEGELSDRSNEPCLRISKITLPGWIK